MTDKEQNHNTETPHDSSASELSGLVSRPARIRGTHPYSFRSGEWAEIIGVRMCTPHGLSERPAYECRFDDGVIYYIAISDAPHYEIGG